VAITSISTFWRPSIKFLLYCRIVNYCFVNKPSTSFCTVHVLFPRNARTSGIEVIPQVITSPASHRGRIGVTSVNRTTNDSHYGAVLFTDTDLTSYPSSTDPYSFPLPTEKGRDETLETLGGTAPAAGRCDKKSPPDATRYITLLVCRLPLHSYLYHDVKPKL